MRAMTLSQIRKFAEAEFTNRALSAAHLLVAWGRHDADGELDRLLAGTGMSARKMTEVAGAMLDEPTDQDHKLVTNCIVEVAEGPATGRHLLRSLCSAAEYRVTLGLVAAGLDLARLRENLDGESKAPVGILAQHDISTGKATSVLAKYGRELTKLAGEGAFDELCDRPGEIERIVDVLLRRQKRHCALTGTAGVGKTALVELLARRIAQGNIPASLRSTPLWELRIADIVAGTKYRGEFEQRMLDVLKVITEMDSVIVFIDEMHLIWGAGRAEDVITDAANILKPYLARERFRVIGATTVEEYQRYIARDAALARRFQELRLAAPDDDTTYAMVAAQARSLEHHHNVVISEDSIRRAIELTNRHVPQRWQPDKTVDLLDSTAVAVLRTDSFEIGDADLLRVLAKQTGRPISALTGDDRDSLLQLADKIKARIVGQDHAVETIAATLAYRRQELGAPDRPLGVFLCVGESGVGKTETARVVAEEFCGNRDALLCVDLSEYNTPHSADRLIGSPPGYADSQREGIVTGFLHGHGSGVLLFDEVEKAHPDVRMLLLGLLDNGRITSGRGETLDASQCVVMLTTNALRPEQLSRGTFGFRQSGEDLNPRQLLVETFPDEFLGRIDEVILFNHLDDDAVRAILQMRLDEALVRLEKQNIRVTYDANRLLAFLLAELNVNRAGARGAARVLEKKVLEPIARVRLRYERTVELRVDLSEAFYESGEVTASRENTSGDGC